jgi:hypothetical protein
MVGHMAAAAAPYVASRDDDTWWKAGSIDDRGNVSLPR